MPFKLNISTANGKTWKLETESEALVGHKIGDKISGKEISGDLSGYELIIMGASDSSGFPHKSDVEGQHLRRVLLTKGWGMHKKPRKLGKKKVQTPDGLRLRKTVRGNQISDKTIQINLKVEKEGSKKLAEIFPEQNKPKVKEGKSEKVAEEIAEEVKEEIKVDIPSSPETKTKRKKEEAAEKIAEEVKEEVEEVVEKIVKKDKKEK